MPLRRSKRHDRLYAKAKQGFCALFHFGCAPDTVALQVIPYYDYQYVYINGQAVLVDPASRQIVYVVR